MKVVSTIILLTFLALAAAKADIYSGSFDCTVVNSGGSTPVEVGTVFAGTYNYVSASMDGTFSGLPDPSYNGSIGGGIDLPLALYAAGTVSLDQWSRSVTLVVLDGAVNSFQFCPDLGSTSGNFFTSTFNVTEAWSENWINGTVHWTAPVDQTGPPSAVSPLNSATIPDTTSTALLLAVAMVGLAICRKQTANCAGHGRASERRKARVLWQVDPL